VKRGKTDFETCRLNGWRKGTQLVGVIRFDGRVEIVITAVGDKHVLARRMDDTEECLWDCDSRTWRKAK